MAQDVLYDRISMENKIDIAKIESPCIRNCCLDGNDICMGCFRSLTEITQWTLVDEKTRQEFLKNAAERKSKQKINSRY